jgi:predicted dehydrogenase
MIDLMTFFIGTRIESICYESLTPITTKISSDDNKSIILKYQDGSVCAIEYIAVGDKRFSKEYLEVHFDEKTIVMEDFKTLKGFGLKIDELRTSVSQKGHLEELEILYETLRGKRKEWPIDLWDMIQTTEVTLNIV